MLISIISDIHDNLANLQKVLAWSKSAGVTKIICCGDVTNGDTLEFLAKQFIGEIVLIRGNMDIYEEIEPQNYANIIYLGRFGVWELEGKKIGLCHEPFYIEKVLAQNQEVKIVFYGHTHKPWLEDKEGVRLVNPGTLGGVFQKGTFSVWDSETNNLELKLLELL